MRRRRLAALLAAAAVTLSGCGFHGLYDAPLPGGADLGDHPFSVTAYFSDALDLVPQSAVKVDDVPVGKVTSIDLADCPNPDGGRHTVWCAKVTVKVNGSVDLPANARAQVLQTSLLGEKYVALLKPTTGASTGRLRDGAQIPLSRTQSAPETEDVLGALSLVLNGGGINQIRIIATELNKALGSKDRQTATRDLISQLSTFTGTLNSQKDKITDALDDIDTLSVTLKKQRKVIADALQTFPPALKALSQERTKLVTLLSSLSHLGSVATNVINASQQDLVAALKSLQPAVEQLTASGSNLVGALRIAGTYPFPLGLSRKFVKGDYANLDVYVTLNLADLVQPLCDNGVPQSVCDTLQGLISKLPLSERTKKITAKKPAPATLTPTLLGSGS